MMTPGAALLKFRQTFGHGLRTAYYRDVVRPRILEAPPVEGLADTTCEIHVLTSANDWLNLIWALRSFYAASGERFALCIHDDGTLPEDARKQLQRQFPDARLIERSVSDREVGGELGAYPRSRRFRETNVLSLKVFDFRHYLRSERMLLLDSDVLFFSKPEALLARIHDPLYRCNSVNRDVKSCYTADPAEVLAWCGVAVVERFNSGLGVIHRDALRLDWIEEFLGIPGIIGKFWLIEQTLYAILSSRFGVELLPEEYDVRLQEGVQGLPCRHYVGAIRHLMYKEGVRALASRLGADASAARN